MNTSLDCVPCLVRQAIETSRIASNDETVQVNVLRSVLKIIADADFSQPPPLIAQWLHRRLKEITGIDDPYEKTKEGFNRLTLSLLDILKKDIEQSDNPLLASIKLSIAGNVIDSGATAGITEAEIRKSISVLCSEVLNGDVDEFLQAIASAKKIMFIADNAGEIVLDRPLIEMLGPERVILAVRGFPVINDATIIDARAAGLDRIMNVIENGSDAPGTILEECSEEFIECFEASDLIISKGQGNYETLCDVEKNIYFLLKVKCRIIADHTGFPVGTHAIIQSATGIKSNDSEICEVEIYA